MRFHFTLFVLVAFALQATRLAAQEDDLLSLLGDEEETTDYATASFKTNRVINLHSIENTARGVLDFKISHRFGELDNGLSDLFGLDAATIRLSFDYGITDALVVGIGRSTFDKTIDAYAKYKLLRQSKGKVNMPLTLAVVAGSSIYTYEWPDPDRENFFSSRLAYFGQVIIGRKFSEGFSLQLSPTWVHRNLVEYTIEKNDVWALGIGGRIKLTKRLAINGEYIYVLPDQLLPGYRNSLSIGFDIETGGHVFQLHFTNSSAMFERGFITQTSSNWSDGGIRFGFNLSRVFTLAKPKFE